MNTYIDTLTEISTDSKYRRWYLSIITTAKTRANTKKEAKKILGGYTEAHHILPKSFGLGGAKDSDNLIYLSGHEHFVCHLLLTRIFTEGEYSWKMNAAVSYFTGKNKNFKGRRILTGWEYEQCRKAIAKANSDNKSREVEIDGIIYKNTTLAADILGLSREIITPRLLSGAYPTWFYTDGKTIKNNQTEPFKIKTKKIMIENKIYSSINEASREIGLSIYIISERLKYDIYPEYKYLDGTPKIVSPTKRKNGIILNGILHDNITTRTQNPISVRGVIYDAIRDAARITGETRSMIRGRANNPKHPEYQWVVDTQILENMNSHLIPCPGAPGRKVIVSGIQYPSLAKAAKAYNCSISTISNRADSTKFPEYEWM